ncbi:MAG TPA: sugar phosphate isomerase/epimerase family protein [Candidatus Methylomirabilis sp.]|nr:sugar phosphate isomerase/epimerase family protein [Candidatus Methylomirabilis sp.]
MRRMTRRGFVKTGVAAACAAGMSAGATGREAVRKEFDGAVAGGNTGPAFSASTQGMLAPLPIKKGLVFDMLPTKLSYTERLKLAREVGFEVVQAPTTPDKHEAEEIKKAAEAANIRIDSVMNMAHWEYPLSSGDAAVVEKSMEGMRTSLHNAKLWGSDAVLLVPAVVNAQTTYKQAWQRSQKQIRKMIPLAAELKVVIAIEEVWNKFLLSPLEMQKYVEEFQSPWIRAWFDVGNVVFYGYPQDWIRTLGSSIYKVHIKDFKRKKDGYAWVNLGEGDVEWGAVRQAFQDVGYAGSAIAELDGGDEPYLRDVSKRMDRLVVGLS